MSDLSEDFTALREYSKEKRAMNREFAVKRLNQESIEFTVHNEGAHFVVNSAKGKIDFWPGTGKFIFRERNMTGRGIFNLIKLVKA